MLPFSLGLSGPRPGLGLYSIEGEGEGGYKVRTPCGPEGKAGVEGMSLGPSGRVW